MSTLSDILFTIWFIGILPRLKQWLSDYIRQTWSILVNHIVSFNILCTFTCILRYILLNWNRLNLNWGAIAICHVTFKSLKTAIIVCISWKNVQDLKTESLFLIRSEEAQSSMWLLDVRRAYTWFGVGEKLIWQCLAELQVIHRIK